MKAFRYFFVLAALLLTLPACGQDEAIPVCPALPTESTAQDGSETTMLCLTMLMPEMRIHYTDEDASCYATLTPSSSYIYGEIHENGEGRTSLSYSTRPCEKEDVCTVYSADPEGEVRLAYFPYTDLPDIEGAEFYAAAALPSLTLTAYPATEDGTVNLAAEKSQSVPITDGRFTMLKGWYYYELGVTMEEGDVTYGFIGYRTEEYEYTETVSGCCVEIYDEDPDSYAKSFPTISLMYQIGERRFGRILRPYGELRWTYTNHAGTQITRAMSTASPREQENIYWITSKDLARDYEFEEDTRYPIEQITVTVTPLDPKESSETFVITDRKLTLRPEAYYEFLVEYANGQASYGLMTGAALPAQAHPHDDPAIDPELAKQMRADYRTHMLKTQGSSAFSDFTLDTVYVEKYFGMFGSDFGGDIPVVRMGSVLQPGEIVRIVPIGPYELHFPNNQLVYAYFNSFLFDTLADSYGKGHLTDEDIYQLGCMIDSTFASRYPTP